MRAGRHRALTALSLTILIPLATAAAEPLPVDGGIVNVRDYGARGNGRDDDTAALLAAIAASGGDTGRSFWHDRIVYLPDGTYPVSGTLLKRYANGGFASGMVLVGESRAHTVIRLADHAPGFGDPKHPRAVVFTASKLLDGTPVSGGKDYHGLGEGNDAYMNFVQDLTIDVGRGNSGAIAIDYLANNIGAIRNVTLRATADSGAVGLSMTRKWPGPALIERLAIDGFGVGIAAAQTEYGLTLDHVTLRHQREAGLRNERNVIAAHDLVIRDSLPAIVNSAREGLIAIDGGQLPDTSRTSGALSPIENRGVVVLRRLTVAGSPQPAIAEQVVLNGGDTGPSAPLPSWLPRPADSPTAPSVPLDRWANAAHFGAVAGPTEDSTQALRRAFASGAAVVYLPHGEYWISAGLDLPPTVRRIVGLNSTIRVLAKRQPGFSRDSGMLRIASGGEPLSIENLAFDNTDMGRQLAIEVSGARDVTIRDVVSAGVTLLDRKADGGRVFIEDVCCGPVRLAGPQPVYARQLDTEGGGVRIVNSGAPLWLLGLKTEGICTVLDNRDGARSDVFGGLLYMVRDPGSAPPVPALRNAGGRISATFAEEVLRPGHRYQVYLSQEGGARNRNIGVAGFPERGLGRIVPGLVAPPAGGAAQ